MSKMLEEKIDLILRMSQELIGTRSMFVSRTGNGVFSILKARNSKNGSLVNTGESMVLNDIV
ncbi:hypothetical protein [Litchfieldia salsa]|uniref:Uncharacterized protein n=1 Tax=Litchfieldia salsa TaxID=930152 RepID=A0A1H0Q513_9BACI|nr:hypothetical protein [Litchfieldia salsa]SDP12473.1 hypothetical protein SAMN05216565_101606 [Litchfieldia salsa]